MKNNMQAIYARQSADKKDSISIETQIEECKKRLSRSEAFEVFSDKGYSGKNIERPRFQEMMLKVKNGEISRIIIYKFDRMSRSLKDFMNMQEIFEQFDVEIVSCNEQFDTGNSMGEGMLNILMVFAEMERKAIQQRITDNYYSRGEQGLYLGGYAPFGYEKIEIRVNGKKTYTFKENPKESILIQQMYTDYSNGKSVAEIARELNRNNILTRKGKLWSSDSVARILKNPVYVRANADVYNYLRNLGGHMNNSVEEYIGENGCYVYGRAADRKTAKFVSFKSDYVTLGLHKGIIDSSIWLSVQQIFQKKKGHSNLGTGNLTWLQGIIKCRCGYTLYVKRYKTKNKEYRYLYCRGRKNNSCKYPRTMVKIETIEDIVEEELFWRLKALKGVQHAEIVRDTPEINALKIKIADIDKKIENIIKQIAEGSDVVGRYLNEYIKKLDSEKNILSDQIMKLELQSHKTNQISFNPNEILRAWSDYSISTKKNIAKEMIKMIVLEGKEISIIFY